MIKCVVKKLYEVTQSQQRLQNPDYHNLEPASLYTGLCERHTDTQPPWTSHRVLDHGSWGKCAK
jgi:hypothetical protein